MNKQEKGFTIIEVVLVLAIAALIFLMIFIALPALQRQQRDSARKNDANVVAAAISSYRSNNRNQNPPDMDALEEYIDNLNQYDKGEDLSFGESVSSLDEMAIAIGSKCNTEGEGIVDGSSKQAAIVYMIEANGASEGVPACQDA